MYLISVYFDEQTEKRIQGLIRRVAKETGNSFMLDNQVPPHMTIAAVETKHEDLLIASLDKLTKKMECGKINFVSVGAFVPQVIYVQPVLNEYLHNLSASLIQELEQIEETICSPYYQPFQWLPHCTIAKQLSKEQLLQAFEVLQNHFTPIDGQVVHIGVAKTNPHRDIQVWGITVEN